MGFPRERRRPNSYNKRLKSIRQKPNPHASCIPFLANMRHLILPLTHLFIFHSIYFSLSPLNTHFSFSLICSHYISLLVIFFFFFILTSTLLSPSFPFSFTPLLFLFPFKLCSFPFVRDGFNDTRLSVSIIYILQNY